ncbi:MAG: hypothetical protein J7501_05760 [Bdellovibrio sp.]|nr:hypothetical protein [Bdellovibrio sp.]
MKSALSCLLICSSFLFIGCQPGSKKTLDTQVHSQGVSELDAIAAELATLSLPLNVNADKLKNSGLTLEANDTNDHSRALLESYVFKADKILALGDTRVVIFPEKEKIVAARNVAYQYLGRLYALLDILNTTTPVDNKTVAYAESEARLARIRNMILTFNKHGVTLEVIQAAKTVSVIKKMSSEALTECIALTTHATNNAVRMLELGEKYTGFGIPDYTKAFSSVPALAYTYSTIGELMAEELKSR